MRPHLLWIHQSLNMHGVHVGRLAGQQAIEDMRQELWSSVQAVASFGAEMEGLPGTLESLATIVDTLCEAGQPLEIIRKESLSALAVRAASRMLQMAYSAIIAIEPLRLPALPLPVSHGRGPAFFGAVAPMLTPWLTLALMSDLKAGPVSLAFTHGQRITALPPMVCLNKMCWPYASYQHSHSACSRTDCCLHRLPLQAHGTASSTMPCLPCYWHRLALW